MMAPKADLRDGKMDIVMLNDAGRLELLRAFPEIFKGTHINNEKLIYKLFDMQGKFLSKEVFISNQTQINMSDLPVATYFLIVIKKNRKIQSFKIIKQ